MALPHTILVPLCVQSGSGDELATHQQIYLTMRPMEDNGWAHVTPLAQQGVPDKEVYTVAEVGRAERAAPLDVCRGSDKREFPGPPGPDEMPAALGWPR